MKRPYKKDSNIVRGVKPIHEYNKQELLWLINNQCKHRHSYISHISCLPNDGERIGFVDIETSSLEADYGIIFCYCILDQNGKLYHDEITKSDIKRWGKKGREDTRVIQSLIRDMKNFDRLVGHFSSLYDLPFIRTRAVMCEVKYPNFGVYVQSDTWRILRNKFKLSRNSLENGTRNLLGKTRKNHLSLPLKNECLRGKKWAIDYTLKHCIYDVKDTRDLWNTTSPFIKLANTSF